MSHGNAEDLGDDRYWLENLRHVGFSVFAYDYEGYGTSEGQPGERTAYEDEASAYDYLAVNLKTAPDSIIILGGPWVRARQHTSQRKDLPPG